MKYMRAHNRDHLPYSLKPPRGTGDGGFTTPYFYYKYDTVEKDNRKKDENDARTRMTIIADDFLRNHRLAGWLIERSRR